MILTLALVLVEEEEEEEGEGEEGRRLLRRSLTRWQNGQLGSVIRRLLPRRRRRGRLGRKGRREISSSSSSRGRRVGIVRIRGRMRRVATELVLCE